MEVRREKYCKHCKKDTLHVIRENALEIEYRCTRCDKQEEVIKTFF